MEELPVPVVVLVLLQVRRLSLVERLLHRSHPREADFFGVRVFRAEVAHAAKANLRRPDPSAQVQPAFVQPRPTPVYPAWHEAQRRRDVRRVL